MKTNGKKMGTIRAQFGQIRQVCVFGDYDPEYIRNDVIIEGFRRSGVSVELCNVRSLGMKKYWELTSQFFALVNKPDLLLVGSSDTSRWIVLLAWFITRFSHIPLVWDAHYSIYDAYVNDRQLTHPNGIKAKYYWAIDKMASTLSGIILLDTFAHIKYFAQEFRVSEEKFLRVFVGSNIQRFIVQQKSCSSLQEKEKFIVNFHGKYIPLQGVPTIIRAAKILEQEKDIHFRLIGRGQTYNEVQALAKQLQVKNVEFISRVPYSEIPFFLCTAHVSLGIFGDTDKANRVIPNKIYEAIELGVPVITANTDGINELFTDRKDILLCNVNDPEDLASAIREIRGDKKLREDIGAGGRRLWEHKVTPLHIGSQLLTDLRSRVYSDIHESQVC